MKLSCHISKYKLFKIGAIFLYTLFLNQTQAQLKANFSADKIGGCSPLTIQFTNTTSGASANVSYKWDLGNGNISTLKNAGATYRGEHVYTITLTAKDGNKSSTKTLEVTVYQKPTIDFSATPLTGCIPLDVTFTSIAQAGAGTISSYFWDFGDGTTQQGATLQTDLHTYNFQQNTSISLTVTNSYGCYNTLTKPSFINVLQGPNASFSANKNVLCQITDSVQFVNNSSGSGTLSYLWNFGDGVTSSSVSPAHIFSAKGIYPISLTVTNSDGCTSDTTIQSFINVADFSVGFTVPLPICVSSSSIFTDTSTAGATFSSWKIDNTVLNNFDNNLNYSFNQIGKHTIQLSKNFGDCPATVSKEIIVNPLPDVKGFIADFGSFCGAPTTVQFQDTTKSATQWLWQFNYPNNSPTATTQLASYTFTSNLNYAIGLTVQDALGCSTTVVKNVNITPPYAIIILTKSSSYNNVASGCVGYTAEFAALPDSNIVDFSWNFGDGGISTAARPSHTFNKAGTYTITLNYTTKEGCKATATYTYIYVIDKVSFNFTASDTLVCGNTPVNFTVHPSEAGWYFSWNFGDNSTGSSYNTNGVAHQYQYDSVYTVTLIGKNYGCMDTVVKEHYVKVLPPFPKISSVTNTCDGNRGQVTFGQASYKASSWLWNFGDGTSVSYTTNQPIVKHNFSASGKYNVVLTTTNGACTVSDSINTYVLLKQNPVLSSTKNFGCGNDKLDVTINKLDANPNQNNYGYDYTIMRTEYGDSTISNGVIAGNNFFTHEFNGTIQGLKNGEKDIRMILQSTYFGCYDTTNFLPLTIKGPTAGFTFLSQNPCFKYPVIAKDTSVARNNVPIQTWEWNFSDGSPVIATTSTTETHLYSRPDKYAVSLKVTDREGCTDSTPINTYYANPSGPKVDFQASATNISPGTTVYFNNTTNNYNSSKTQYLWYFKDDGTTSTNVNPSHTFNKLGTDTVMLFAYNSQTGCTDTALKLIHVQKVNTAFTFVTNYINNNKCPPVIINFTSKSSFASRVKWNFGDGSIAVNQLHVSHTYNQPGIYRVVLYGYDVNGGIDSVEDFIEVKGPYALITADRTMGCDSLSVQLNAEVKNANTFIWDFADGTLQATNDTFSIHTYLNPGVYTPSLILKNVGGCSSSSEYAGKIIIDSLTISYQKSPAFVCDSGYVYFTPTIASIAKDQLQQPLEYHWNFGTANPVDTSATSNGLFYYHQLGNYPVNLTVGSPYGCSEQFTDTVMVKPIAKGNITGSAVICANDFASFQATATHANDGLQWFWNFGNNTQSILQNPTPQTYTDSGLYQIALIINNSGCFDTSYHSLTVHGLPFINPTPKETKICLGSSVQLQANGGDQYVWLPNSNLDNASIASPIASPEHTTIYTVNVTNLYSCVASDSLKVNVVLPFEVVTPPKLYECMGSTVQLTASGADIYTWINGTGLSNTQISNPLAQTDTTTLYTVVGYDNLGCFSDTASILVEPVSLPTVTAGPNITVPAGSILNLEAISSSDAVSWSWSPETYLSCVNCVATISKPRAPITYFITATNKYGCVATDSIIIQIYCAKSLVNIPTAFTPNGDGINDKFNILGNGINRVNHLLIFGRWGEKIFEKNNFDNNDQSSSWDGTYKGQMMPPGTYVFMAELVCDLGEVYTYKGTITLIR